MKYLKTITAAVFATVLLVTAQVKAADDADKWTLSLAGSGTTAQTAGNATQFGTEVQLGHTGKLILPLEVGGRQSLSWSSEGNTTVFGTRLYADFTLLKLGKNLSLLGGANVGASYGDTSLTWVAGPEIEGRLNLRKSVYVFGRAQYDFNLNGRTDIKDTALDKFRYALGIGVSF